MSVVTQKSITYVNNTTEPTITTKELDLDTCFKDNEIVIKIHAAALNPVDGMLHSLCNKYITGCGLKTYGKDFAGVIIRRGKNVNVKWPLEAKVNGQLPAPWKELGSFSTYLICNPEKVISINIIPETPSVLLKEYNEFVINAAWPLVFGTAYSGLYSKKQVWNKDSKVLVIGASTSVANCLIQIAKKELKIGTVVGICSTKAVENNKAFGFDYLVPYDGEKGVVEGVKDLIKNKLNGEKFDLIFDSVGNDDFFSDIDDILKPKNTNSQYLTIAGDKVMKYSDRSLLGHISFKSQLRQHLPFRKFNYEFQMLQPAFNFMELGATMLSDGRFVPEIDSVFKFEDYKNALTKLEDHTAKGKVILQMEDE